MYTSRWRRPYELYRELHRVWPPDCPKFVLRSLLKTRDCQKRAKEWETHRQVYRDERGVDLNTKIAPQWLEWTEEVWRAFNETRSRTEPFEDAYQAALHMLLIPSEFEETKGQRLFRGQRCRQWSITPSLFRGAPSEAELARRKDRLVSFVDYLKRQYHDRYHAHELHAIAQHYISGTWLIDLTWSPWVALFFASLPGKTPCDPNASGDIGALYWFKVSEWQHLSADGTNALGAITYIEPKNVPRIAAQQAVFLVGSHHDLIMQYMPFTLTFHQHSGVIFEDPSQGVTNDLLFPKEDELLKLKQQWEREWTANPQTYTVSLDEFTRGLVYRKPGAHDYKAIIIGGVESALMKVNGPPALDPQSPAVSRLIDELACFHTCLYELGGSTLASRRELERAIEGLFIGLVDGDLSTLTLKELIRWGYAPAARGDEDWKIIRLAEYKCTRQ